jgi:2-polyprenyl-6-methoxyphenol hydroxylase-like FAD-dependent oxidoreductase
MDILICGAGIAGPTLAYWLQRHGFTPTIVERAPALRTGGYIIDFWGAGFDVAERMGLAPRLLQAGYRMREVRTVDDAGARIAGFPAEVFTSALGGRFTSLTRSELAAAIVGALDGRVETIFGDTIDAIDQAADHVDVQFAHHGRRRFDLVIGADGLHSRVRSLVFDPDERVEKYLGLKVAAFSVTGYRPRDELIYMMYAEVGGQAARFAMRDDRTMFLFTFADPNPDIPADEAGQKAALRARFGRSGWECPRILEALDSTSDLYFDRVSQVQMDPAQGLWTRGRVTLAGDAASCVSLLGGQGSALAMIAAYVIAGELKRARGDYRAAFARYQDIFAPFVLTKQRAARRFIGTFAPPSRLSLFVRNRILQMVSLPIVARLVAGRGFSDRIRLEDY